MIKYQVYKHIRGKATIIGLSVSFFALQMVSVIGSLLITIFSFSVTAIVSVFCFNTGLYAVLVKLTNHPALKSFKENLPQIISNKKVHGLEYEKD